MVASVLSLYPDLVAAHLDASLAATDPVLVAPIVELSGGRAQLDERHAAKQPDWSYAQEDSGAWPAAALGNTPVHVAAPTPGRGAAAHAKDGALDAPAPAAALESLRRSHLRIAHLATQAQAADTSATQRKDLLGEVVTELAIHDDVNERILYPMLRRVAGDDGEALADAAGQREHSLVARLHALIDDGASSDGDEQLTALSKELEERFADDERRVEPLLLRHLDADARADLDDALEEARLTSQEHA